MLAPIVEALVLGLYAAVAVILVRKYVRTRDVGFVWLGVAVVAWPLASLLLRFGERDVVDRVFHHRSVIYPFNLIGQDQHRIFTLMTYFSLSKQLIGVCFLLVAVIYLAKGRSSVDIVG